jgi:hypothetical protein
MALSNSRGNHFAAPSVVPFSFLSSSVGAQLNKVYPSNGTVSNTAANTMCKHAKTTCIHGNSVRMTLTRQVIYTPSRTAHDKFSQKLAVNCDSSCCEILKKPANSANQLAYRHKHNDRKKIC